MALWERRAFWVSTTVSYFVALPLVSAQAMRAVLGFGIAFGAATGHVSLIVLAVFAFALNTGEVLYDIAPHSYLPALVPETMLQRANSRLVTAETVVFEFAGPATAGFLFALGAIGSVAGGLVVSRLTGRDRAGPSSSAWPW